MSAEKRYALVLALAHEQEGSLEHTSFHNGMCNLPLVHLQKIVRQAYPLLELATSVDN